MKKSFMRLFSVLMAFMMMSLFLMPSVYAYEAFRNVEKNERGAIKVKKAYVYEYAQTDSKRVCVLPFAAKVNIIKENGKWFFVTFKQKDKSIEGYMKKEQVVMYNKTKKHIALTFDDGPSIYSTGKVLKALKKNNARATFFVLGSMINSKTANLIKKEKELGCEVANHSYSHPDLTFKKSKQIKKQLSKTDRKIKKITGQRPTIVRAPYGSYSKKVLKIMNRPNIYWSVDTRDWKYRNTKKLIKTVKKQKRNGAVILMHDIHMSTAKGVDNICRYLKMSGYEMVTVTELAAIRGKNLKVLKTYRSF